MRYDLCVPHPSDISKAWLGDPVLPSTTAGSHGLFLRPRQRRSVASPVEFIPSVSVVSSGFKLRDSWTPSTLGGWGACSPHPADQDYVVGATHRRSWSGRDSLRIDA